MRTWRLMFLGQSGIRFQLGKVVLYVDPYLTDSVAESEGPHLSRLTAPRIQPHEVEDADFVFISHDHQDHCDPRTIGPLSIASPQARFIGPPPVLRRLSKFGIESNRLIPAAEDWLELSQDVRLCPVPAAHPKVVRDNQGFAQQVGSVIEYADRRCYFAGDTAVDPEVVDAIDRSGPVSVGFIPVNEPNYYRSRAGIIGNMSVRDAFAFGEEIGLDKLVPIHWDLFAPNQVYREEIELLYEKIRPPFDLVFAPELLG